MDSSFLRSVSNTEPFTTLDNFESPLPGSKFGRDMDLNESMSPSLFNPDSLLVDLTTPNEVTSLQCKQNLECQEYDKYV